MVETLVSNSCNCLKKIRQDKKGHLTQEWVSNMDSLSHCDPNNPILYYG